MELYDEELELEPYKEIGIHTLPAIDTADGTLDEVITELFTAQLALLEDEKFTVALGGEHSLTPPLVSAIAKKYKHLSVLQIDAHADLRDEYQGNPASHACAMRACRRILPRRASRHSVAIGGRGEGDSPSPNQGLLGERYCPRAAKSWIAKVLADLSADVYLTIDLDGFDPSIVPATGTPEPGGLDWVSGHLL